VNLNSQLNKNILSSQWSSAVNTWFSLRIDLISLTIMAFSSVFCLFYGEDDSSPSGRVYPVMLLTYVLILQDYILWTLKCFAEIEQRMVNIDRCLKILDIPQENLEGSGEYQKVLNSGWPNEGKIEFQNVFLRYRPNTEIVLKDLSFGVSPKEKLGIVGRTGSGKSTICLSLSRIVEIENGKILIDGVDIKTIPIKELRKRITVIP
jgi:ABC-type multidrug transport system fused ATPase/permease subunit